MAEEPPFEPRLGEPGQDRRRAPPSQLKALAKAARWGKVRTYARPKLAWGTVWRKGRGKGAAAITRHHAHPARRRLFLKTSIAVAGPTGTKAFSAHIAYIARDGTAEQEGPGKIFDRASDDADPKAFNQRARSDVRQFRWLISPDDVGEMQDLTRFTRTLMNQVERDLRREVDWVAASHFNTVHPHIHIAIRGGDPRADELIISKDYLFYGLRHRIEEALAAELGLRRAPEIAADLSRSALADRYTAIDRDLGRAAQSGYVDLSRPVHGTPGSSWSSRISRLTHLRSRGLAEHMGGPVWRLVPGWEDTLRQLGRQQNANDQLAQALGDRFDPGNLQDFSTGLPGAYVTGRLAGVVIDRARTEKHLLILEGLDGRQWTARVPAREALALPEPGSVLTFFSASGGPAAARTEPGETDPEVDLQPVRFIVDTWIPIEQQVRLRAYTWLDQIDAASLSDATGFGAEAREARAARQTWLETEGLFPPSREDLQAEEFKHVVAAQANRLGRRFVQLGDREVFRGSYAGHVDTAQGRFAVIAGETRFTLTASSEGQAPALGQQAIVERNTLAFGRLAGRSRTIPD